MAAYEEIKIVSETVLEEGSMQEFKGRITMYTISGCPYCKQAKSVFKKRELPWTEINLDLYPESREEMIARTNKRTVPQIFFNDRHIGGAEDINKLSEEDFQSLIDLVRTTPVDASTCPPLPSVSEHSEIDCMSNSSHAYLHVPCETDKYFDLVTKMRDPTQDPCLIVKHRKWHLRTYKYSFVGQELVQWFMAHNYATSRESAVELGNVLLERHFFHHVTNE